jgi:hypothetical protein
VADFCQAMPTKKAATIAMAQNPWGLTTFINKKKRSKTFRIYKSPARIFLTGYLWIKILKD